MKITRFARGYRLRLTDGEMMALHTALGMVHNRLAKGEIDGACRAAGLRVNRPLRAFLEGRGLRVDQDLRPVLKRSAVKRPHHEPVASEDGADG
jgi:hypothetical protein